MAMASGSIQGKKSALHDWHLKHQARMSIVEDYHAPLWYTSVEAEYQALRTGSALVDLACFGLLRLPGEKARPFLNQFVTTDMIEPRVGTITQTLICNDSGQTVDRLMVLFQESHLLVITTPGRGEAVAEELSDVAISSDTHVENFAETQALFALVGPRADETLATALRVTQFGMENGELLVTNIFTAKVILVCTVLFGEPAYLIVTGHSYAPIVAERLMEGGPAPTPVGLAAAEVARLEAGEIYGRTEMTGKYLPVELGLMPLVDHGKRRFVGKDVVVGSAVAGEGNWLVSVVMKDLVIPRRHAEIYSASNEIMGRVTAGAWNPRLKNGFGMAIVDRRTSVPGMPLWLNMHGRRWAMEVGVRPYYLDPLLPQKRR